jgi:RNA polymerase sigma factor (sigma-70 family)
MPGKYIVPPQCRSENLLVSAAQNGDHRAIEHLIIEYTPIRSLIATLMRRVDPNGRASDDLEGAARLSILEALRSFNPARGARFTTYAYYFVRGAMLKTLYPPAERYRHNGEFARVRFISLEEPSDPQSDHRSGHEQNLLNHDPQYGLDPGYASIEDASRDAVVREFVDALQSNQRTITKAAFWKGHTHGEIACERGTSRPAVTRTLQRVLARAEQELAELELAA